MSEETSITASGSLAEVLDYLAAKGLSAAEIEAITPADVNASTIAKNCRIETQPCKPPGLGNYGKGERSRVVCEDENGKEYPGVWGPCIAMDGGV